MSELPVLYSFRRCPYAMRARMAIWISGMAVELREVKLADKPAAMLQASPKGTVPVLVLPDGKVVDESLAIMRHALSAHDPEGWLERSDASLIECMDGPFKHHLDRYKYYTRHGSDPDEHRAAALSILRDLDARLAGHANLCGAGRGLTDIASFPFVRQFANHDREWFGSQSIANVQAWLERHVSSPLFAAIMEKQAVWSAGDPLTQFGQGNGPRASTA